MGDGSDRVSQERDLGWKLLELGHAAEPRETLMFILELLVKMTGAERAYLELYAGMESAKPRWAASQGCTQDDEQEIRSVTSRGIVAAALASGTTIHTAHALLDDRFASQESVKDQRIEAVLCAPLGASGAGVLYLEGKRGAGRFSDSDVAVVKNAARHLGSALSRVAHAEESARREDPTRSYRERLRLEGIAGRSAALARVFAQVEPYAPLDVTILLSGASGTGKTQLARAIHDNGPRRNGPFLELNCAAIPEGLFESELFGTMPNAFPGARRAPGKVQAAEGGTLFLDEIVEIPLTAQAKLLQFLQSRQYYALASTTLTTANVRLIVATNTNLAEMVVAKRFREDLFHRINVVTIRMPSLSERKEDVPLLIDDFIARFAAEHRLVPLPASEQLKTRMMQVDLPGNVREVRNTIARALIIANAEGAPQIELRHVSREGEEGANAETYHEATRAFQRELLKRELASCEWNVTQVAERLDLTRSHVYNLISQFELKAEQDKFRK